MAIKTIEQLRAHTMRSGNCWIWTGYTNAFGYGYCGKIPGTRTPELAHRRAYRLAYGELEPNVQVHHTCHNRTCLNPEHLIAMTAREHRDAHMPDACRRGHPYPENLATKKNGHRYCKACDAERQRRNRQTDTYRARERARWKRRTSAVR